MSLLERVFPGVLLILPSLRSTVAIHASTFWGVGTCAPGLNSCRLLYITSLSLLYFKRERFLIIFCGKESWTICYNTPFPTLDLQRKTGFKNIKDTGVIHTPVSLIFLSVAGHPVELMACLTDVLLSAFDCGDSGKCFSFDCLEQGATAGGHVAHAVCKTEFVDTGH